MTTPLLPLNIGFSGTRLGMSDAQRRAVDRLLTDLADIHRVSIVAHHGCCVGADEDFHALCRKRHWRVTGHLGLDGEFHPHLECDVLITPMTPYEKRNTTIIAAIVSASHIVIAAPPGDTPWPPGGVWDMIGAATRALQAGKLRELHVVGRDGERLDYTRWRL